jgi:hypothetical protein
LEGSIWRIRSTQRSASSYSWNVRMNWSIHPMTHIPCTTGGTPNGCGLTIVGVASHKEPLSQFEYLRFYLWHYTLSTNWCLNIIIPPAYSVLGWWSSRGLVGPSLVWLSLQVGRCNHSWFLKDSGWHQLKVQDSKALYKVPISSLKRVLPIVPKGGLNNSNDIFRRERQPIIPSIILMPFFMSCLYWLLIRCQLYVKARSSVSVPAALCWR